MKAHKKIAEAIYRLGISDCLSRNEAENAFINQGLSIPNSVEVTRMFLNDSKDFVPTCSKDITDAIEIVIENKLFIRKKVIISEELLLHFKD